MVDQWDPVSLDEKLLRRVPAQWCNTSLPQPIQRVAFEPNESDMDGLSLFRELFITPEELAQTGRKPGTYFIGRLRASDVLELQLTIRPDPREDQPAGHVVIPELSFTEMKQRKSKSKELQNELAKLAGKDIAYKPAGA